MMSWSIRCLVFALCLLVVAGVEAHFLLYQRQYLTDMQRDGETLRSFATLQCFLCAALAGAWLLLFPPKETD